MSNPSPSWFSGRYCPFDLSIRARHLKRFGAAEAIVMVDPLCSKSRNRLVATVSGVCPLARSPLDQARFVARTTLALMAKSDEIESGGSKFSQVLDAAAKLPGVRINRAAYLRTALKRYCTDEQVDRAIAESPAAAGISPEILKEVANTSISYETSKATALSAAAGIPGGFAMIGTIPADMAQYIGHMLRVAQKLAYVYSWPDLFVEGEEMDEATESILTLFVGVMVGVQLAQSGVTKVSAMIAAQVIKKLPQQALTKGLIYPIVKKVAAYLGVSMTKKLFASGIAKAIPIVGAALSGSLTLATFYPMSKRLQRHLASLELTKPGNRDAGTEADETVTLIVVEEDVVLTESAVSGAAEFNAPFEEDDSTPVSGDEVRAELDGRHQDAAVSPSAKLIT